MSSVRLIHVGVHSTPALVVAPDPIPPTIADDAEPFHPSREDEAFDLGWAFGRCGDHNAPSRLSVSLGAPFLAGHAAGFEAFQREGAYKAGYAVGLISEVTEPPAEFSTWEREAYALGLAKGREDDHADTLARIADRELERAERRWQEPISDRDMYPLGGTT